MAEQDWKTNKRVFAAVSVPTLLWTLLFFVIPMAIVWFYSFGENRGLTEIEFSGTLENYKRATEFLYLSIFGKSFAVAALVTLICLIVGFPVAMAITFASEKWRPWLLLGIMLPFWTNLLIRTYALMMLLGTQGFANKGLGALWDGASWLKTLVGMQPLPTWEPVQLLFNNFAVARKMWIAASSAGCIAAFASPPLRGGTGQVRNSTRAPTCVTCQSSDAAAISRSSPVTSRAAPRSMAS